VPDPEPVPPPVAYGRLLSALSHDLLNAAHALASAAASASLSLARGASSRASRALASAPEAASRLADAATAGAGPPEPAASPPGALLRLASSNARLAAAASRPGAVAPGTPAAWAEPRGLARLVADLACEAARLAGGPGAAVALSAASAAWHAARLGLAPEGPGRGGDAGEGDGGPVRFRVVVPAAHAVPGAASDVGENPGSS
jgi:hypothetical protein